MKKIESFNAKDVVKFDDVVINKGNSYNPATGIFTAPTGGLYVLSCMIMAGDGNAVYFHWYKNAAFYSNLYTPKTAHANSQTQNLIFDLQRGDRVHIQSVGSHKLHGDRYTYFSGYKL